MMCSRPSGGFAARGRCGQRPLDVTGEKLDARSRALVATTTGFALHAPQILRKSLDGECVVAWRRIRRTGRLTAPGRTLTVRIPVGHLRRRGSGTVR